MHLIKNFSLQLKAIKRRHFDRIWRLLTSSCSSAPQAPFPKTNGRAVCAVVNLNQINRFKTPDPPDPHPFLLTFTAMSCFAVKQFTHNLLEKGHGKEENRGGCFGGWVSWSRNASDLRSKISREGREKINMGHRSVLLTQQDAVLVLLLHAVSESKRDFGKLARNTGIHLLSKTESRATRKTQNEPFSYCSRSSSSEEQRRYHVGEH